MVDRMKKKYDHIDSLNMILMIALVSHLAYKLKFMNWLSVESFDGKRGEITYKLNKKWNLA